MGQVKTKRLRYTARKKEKEEHKSSGSPRNIKLSVVCSKILMTPKLNFVNRLGIKLLPGENEEGGKKGGGEKKKRKKKKKSLALLDTHTQMHTHITHMRCAHC